MRQPASEPVGYKGFEIFPKPYQLANGEWAIRVHIMRRSAMKPFWAENTFKSEREARAHCLEFARRIIDGEIPEFSLHDLP
jgi:hypothetical protein